MSDMSLADEQFLMKMLMRIGTETRNKFVGGVEEHGGNIWKIPPLELLEEAKKEFIDGYTYVHTALEILTILLEDPEIQKKVLKIQEELMHNKSEDTKTNGTSLPNQS